MSRTDVVRALFRAYETGDRAPAEEHLHADLVFFSPADPGIDRTTYFERCWPNAQTLASFAFSRLEELASDEVLVTYEATRTDGSAFRNTEVMTFDGDQVVRVEVYFGWELPASR